MTIYEYLFDSPYEKKDFTDEQFSLIQKAIDKGISIEILTQYAKPEISIEDMESKFFNKIKFQVKKL